MTVPVTPLTTRANVQVRAKGRHSACIQPSAQSLTTAARPGGRVSQRMTLLFAETLNSETSMPTSTASRRAPETRTRHQRSVARKARQLAGWRLRWPAAGAFESRTAMVPGATATSTQLPLLALL
jgi:hypothetical protein